MDRRSRNGGGSRSKTGESQKPVSLKFMAEHLGLSPTTISVVINNSPAARSIPQETKDKILKAVAEFNYRPNFFARSLRQKRTFTVAVIVPEISEGYTAAVMAGIEDYLIQENYLYFVASHRGKPELIEEYPEMLMERNVEGFILVNSPLDRDLPLPAVAVASPIKHKGITNLNIDNARGTRLALEHLVGLGHKDIAFFKGHPGSADTEPRWEGLMQAAKEFGLEVHPELCVQLKGFSEKHEPSTPVEGYAYAKKLLDVKRRFTALLAFNDVSAIGAMQAFREAGYRLPQDVSVVGFDDVQAAAYQNPRLTTIRQPMEHMGELAAKTLLDRILNSNGEAQEEILVEPELVIRESTCAPS